MWCMGELFFLFVKESSGFLIAILSAGTEYTDCLMCVGGWVCDN